MAAGIAVHYGPGEESVAGLLESAVRRASDLLRHHWGLEAPQGCAVYVLTHWKRFVLESAPPGRRLLVRLTMPFWGAQAARMFSAVGGWTIPWRAAPAVGVKPPAALQAVSELGSELFKPVPDPIQKLAHVTCHELTHAFTAHLRLPTWLNEGVAMRAVDHLAEANTVQSQSKKWIRAESRVFSTRRFRRAVRKEPRRLLELYATGYWAARRLEERDPGAIRRALSPRVTQKEREGLFRSALGALEPEL